MSNESENLVNTQPIKIKSAKGGIVKNLIGQRFGRLIVLEFVETRNRHTYWRVACDCGGEKVVTSCGMVNGNTKSCGCIKREQTEQLKWSHGCARIGMQLPEYGVWMRMRDRTSNPNTKHWKDYGGRGIKFCNGFDYFPNFLAIVGRRTTPKHHIDRKDNDSHYSCGECDECRQNGWVMNVRWVTNRENANNRRSNHKITINGETLTATQWAERNGLSPHTVIGRINNGWNLTEAATMSVKDAIRRHTLKSSKSRKTNRVITFNGKTQILSDWARDLGMQESSLGHRLDSGWSLEKALTTPPDKRFQKKTKPSRQSVALPSQSSAQSSEQCSGVLLL